MRERDGGRESELKEGESEIERERWMEGVCVCVFGFLVLHFSQDCT